MISLLNPSHSYHPPPGTKLNFVNPPDQVYGADTLHTVCFFPRDLLRRDRTLHRRDLKDKIGIDNCERTLLSLSIPTTHRR